MNEEKWDIFISHAGEDKDTVARPLTAALRRAGARVWLDEHELTVGDSLTEKIDEGLLQSHFGAVILSPAFLAKNWPKKELAGLRSREEEGQKVILPIWHNVDKATVRQLSPILADVLAESTEQGIEGVAEKLLDVIFSPGSESPSRKIPSAARRLIEILESRPSKTTFLDFIRFHLQRRGRYLGWGGPMVLEEYEFGGVKFDAYAPYVGHGARLTLVRFTEVWSDPFGVDQESRPKIRDEIAAIVANIKLIQERFKHDPQWQASLLYSLVKEDSHFGLRLVSDPGYFESWVPDLWFYIYAGRRSKIDATTTTHDTWSELLRDSRDGITIKTYDNILDALADNYYDRY